MALNSLISAGVPLRIYSLTHPEVIRQNAPHLPLTPPGSKIVYGVPVVANVNLGTRFEPLSSIRGFRRYKLGSKNLGRGPKPPQSPIEGEAKICKQCTTNCKNLSE